MMLKIFSLFFTLLVVSIKSAEKGKKAKLVKEVKGLIPSFDGAYIRLNTR